VAVPIASDQAARIARCRALGLIHAAPLAVAAVVDAVASLYDDERERRSLVARAQAAGIQDAMPRILDWIAALAAGARP
jgi:hypothetical protein